VRTGVIIIQVGIVIGVMIWYKLFLPEIQKARTAAEAAKREQRIESIVQSIVVEAAGRESDARAPAKAAHHAAGRGSPAATRRARHEHDRLSRRAAPDVDRPAT
jgi:hypothetical protein